MGQSTGRDRSRSGCEVGPAGLTQQQALNRRRQPPPSFSRDRCRRHAADAGGGRSAGLDPDKSDVVALALGLEHRVTEPIAGAEVELRLHTESRSRSVNGTAQATAAVIHQADDAFDLLARIVLPPGRYELRFGATLSPRQPAGGWPRTSRSRISGDPLSISVC